MRTIAILLISLMLTLVGTAQNSPDYESELNLTSKEINKIRESAERGEIESQLLLGVGYLKGDFGIPKSLAEAAKWITKAAAQGDSDAQYLLSGLYRDGDGVLQDYIEASKWLKKSAEQGKSSAQFSLGLAYYEGRGVEENIVLAHMWVNLAATQGHELAGKVRKTLTEEMESDEILDAQSKARNWLDTRSSGTVDGITSEVSNVPKQLVKDSRFTSFQRFVKVEKYSKTSFAIRLPAVPPTVQTADIQPMYVSQYNSIDRINSSDDEFAQYTVTFNKLKDFELNGDKNISTFLAQMATSKAASMGERLKMSRELVFRGRKAIEFELEYEMLDVKFRNKSLLLRLNENTIVELSVMYASTIKPDLIKYEEFISSFEILN